MKNLTIVVAIVLSAAFCQGAIITIGDNDGYGAGIPDNGNISVLANPITDNRSAAEKAATNGAQFTDTYSTSQPDFSPADQGSVSTFLFTGLSGLSSAILTVDMADFQSSDFGAPTVTYNGITQNWAFDDGFQASVVRTFALSSAVLASINSTGSLTVRIDRADSGDFYSLDYMSLNTNAVPEPGTFVLISTGILLVGSGLRRRMN